MFYMLFLSIVLVLLLKNTRTIGIITVVLLGVFNTVLFALPIFTDLLFYDLWISWVSVQMIANLLLFGW